VPKAVTQIGRREFLEEGVEKTKDALGECKNLIYYRRAFGRTLIAKPRYPTLSQRIPPPLETNPEPLTLRSEDRHRPQGPMPEKKKICLGL